MESVVGKSGRCVGATVMETSINIVRTKFQMINIHQLMYLTDFFLNVKL